MGGGEIGKDGFKGDIVGGKTTNLGEKNVAGFDVAVDDVCFVVQPRERRDQLLGQLEPFRHASEDGLRHGRGGDVLRCYGGTFSDMVFQTERDGVHHDGCFLDKAVRSYHVLFTSRDRLQIDEGAGLTLQYRKGVPAGGFLDSHDSRNDDGW